jgi:hypothetical protein
MRTNLLIVLVFVLSFVACKHKREAAQAPAVASDTTIDPIVKQVLKDSSYSNKTDPFTIASVNLNGDLLAVWVTYSGGCEKHDFDLIWKGEMLKSLPMQLPLYLNHKSNGDACRESITEEHLFNIASLRQPNAKSVKLVLGEFQVLYKY